MSMLRIWTAAPLHYDFARGSPIHEHSHPEEEVYEVIEGELEVTIDGVAQVARAGIVAIVPATVRHSVRARSDGRVIIVDYPARRDFEGSFLKDAESMGRAFARFQTANNTA